MAVTVYTQRICAYCVNAKRLLDQVGARYQEISVDSDPALRQDVVARSGQRTVPQIWIGDTHVGGFDELYALHRQGELKGLLEADGAL